MRKKKILYQYLNIVFDSQQQMWFYKWCQQLKEKGIIFDFVFHKVVFRLSQKEPYVDTKGKQKMLLRDHVFTPDFVISVLPENQHYFKSLMKSTPQGNVSFKQQNTNNINVIKYYIDVKGGFNLYNNHTEFSINQKWTYQLYKIYVNKIEPQKIMEETFVPKGVLYTEKTKKLRQKYKYFDTIQVYLSRKNKNSIDKNI